MSNGTVPTGSASKENEVTAENTQQFLWGAAAIAKAIGVSRRRAFYLLERGYIPARKIGDSWVAEASQLREALTA